MGASSLGQGRAPQPGGGPPHHRGPASPAPAPAPIWVGQSVSLSWSQERAALWEQEKQPQGQARCRQAWLGPSGEGAFLMRKQLGLRPPSGGAGPPALAALFRQDVTKGLGEPVGRLEGSGETLGGPGVSVRVCTRARVLACVFSHVCTCGAATGALEPGEGAGLSGFRAPPPGPWPETRAGQPWVQGPALRCLCHFAGSVHLPRWKAGVPTLTPRPRVIGGDEARGPRPAAGAQGLPLAV